MVTQCCSEYHTATEENKTRGTESLKKMQTAVYRKSLMKMGASAEYGARWSKWSVACIPQGVTGHKSSEIHQS